MSSKRIGHVHKCPACELPLFRYDARFGKTDGIRLLQKIALGARLLIRPKEATKIRCACGKWVVLLKGKE